MTTTHDPEATHLRDLSADHQRVYRASIDAMDGQQLHNPLMAHAILNAFAPMETVRASTRRIAEGWGLQNLGDCFEAAEALLKVRDRLTSYCGKDLAKARIYAAAADTLRVMAPVWLRAFVDAAAPLAPRYALSAPSVMTEGWRVLDTHKGITVSESDAKHHAVAIRDALNA